MPLAVFTLLRAASVSDGRECTAAGSRLSRPIRTTWQSWSPGRPGQRDGRLSTPAFPLLSLCVFSTALPCVCFHWRSLCVSSTLPFLVCVFPLPFHCFSTALHCLTLPCTALHCPERRAALPRRVSQMQGPAGMEPMPDNYILQVGSGHAPENKPAHRMGKSRPGSPHD